MITLLTRCKLAYIPIDDEPLSGSEVSERRKMMKSRDSRRLVVTGPSQLEAVVISLPGPEVPGGVADVAECRVANPLGTWPEGTKMPA
jgi:hypothetical protein